MSANRFLKDEQLPFCRGCGHTTVNQNLEKALQKMGLSPLDVVIVTDIGCHGIIDKSLFTHTVHGLHGRSVAVGSGISAALGEKKKVVVMVGDGGATIGMQHLIDAAHRNFDMTVIVHNNMLYGMTGGQPSEFTPLGFKTPTNPEGSAKPFYDICSLMAQAGANHVSRINGIGDFSDHLVTALARNGFSLVEVMEICPSYGVKANPGMKLSRLVEESGLEIKIFADAEKEPFRLAVTPGKKQLMDEHVRDERRFRHFLEGPVRIIMYGSAGGGIQLAAEMLARAAIRAGLHVSKKGSYPVTVGIGFSVAEIILSPSAIHYTGSPDPDHMIILTDDGRDYAGELISTRPKSTTVWADSAISLPSTNAELRTFNYTERLGARSAAIYSVFHLLSSGTIFPVEALVETFSESKLSQKVDVNKFLDFG